MEFFSAALGFGSILGGLFGSSKQEKLDRQQVQLEYESNLEDIRRRRFEQETIKGRAKALSETAGVLHTGGSTAQEFLNTMAAEFGKEIAFMEKYAREAKRLGIKQAKVSRNTNVFRSLIGGAKTIAESGIFGK